MHSMGGIASTLQRLAAMTLCLTAACLMPYAAGAQQWPERSITLVVCFPPGGGTDIAARLVNTQLGEALGKPVIVENRAGASGNTATQTVARATPDGYTLLMCSSAYVVNPSMFTVSTYDPLKDFIPIMVVGASPNVFTVPVSSPHKSMRELLDWVKANPGKLNWTTPGQGTTPFLNGEYMKQQLGLQMVHVPFSGGGPATQATVAGQVDLYASNLGTVASLVDGGQLRAVAMTSRVRWPDLPNVPTLVELGIKDAVSDTFQGLFAPAGTPQPIIDRIATELGKILNQPEVKEKFRKGGLPVLAEGPAKFKERVAREVAFYKDIVEKGGLKVK